MSNKRGYIPPQGLEKSWYGISPPQGVKALVPVVGVPAPPAVGKEFKLDEGRLDVDYLG